MRHRHTAGLVLAMVGTLVSSRVFAAPPTFDEVGPILARRCGVCHRPEGPAPFSLLTYESAARHARQVAEVSRQRLMPPWKVTPGVNEFRDKEPLSEDDIRTIEEWVRAGAPKGEDAARSTPEEPPGSLGPPDLVVQSTQPYTLRADGPDVFQAFAIAVPLERARYVAGIEFRPARPGIVHHADVLFDRTSRSRVAIEQRQSAEGLLPRSAAFPQGFLLGWTPGQIPSRFPGNLAWRIEPGTDVIVQLHMVPSGKPESLTFSVGFYFTDFPPERLPAMLRLSRQDLRIAPGQAEYLVTDSYVLPVAVDLLSVRPHAHSRARTLTATADLPDGSAHPLIAIDDWDFRWQHTYEYFAPIALPSGTRISMRYTYDNSSAHVRVDDAQRSVQWGPLSSDEMADLWLQVVPREPTDLDRLTADFRQKALMEDARGYENLLQAGRQEALIREDLAAIRLELGQYELAIPHLKARAALNPRSAIAHYNYAFALARSGRIEPAIEQYRAALAVDARMTDARFNLANLLDRIEQRDAAIAEYRELLRVEPGHAAAHSNLAFVLMRTARPDEAMAHLNEAVARDPLLPDAHYNLGLLFAARGQASDAQRAFRRALVLRPAWPSALAQTARTLVAAPNADAEGRSEAFVLAGRAIELSKTRDPELLEVFAMTHAALGRLTEAVQILEEAIAVTGAGERRTALMERMRVYRTMLPDPRTSPK